MKLLLFLLSAGLSLSLYSMGPHIASSNEQFIEAIRHGNYEQAKNILQVVPQGALDVNARIEEGDTLLHKVVRNGEYDLAQLLIKNGANVNVQNTLDGNTPLMEAVFHDHVELADLLIKRGAHVNIPDRHGMTPLQIAASEDDITMVRLLLSKGADALLRDAFGDSPLDAALQAGHMAIAKLLEDSIKSQQAPQVELEDITVVPR